MLLAVDEAKVPAVCISLTWQQHVTPAGDHYSLLLTTLNSEKNSLSQIIPVKSSLPLLRFRVDAVVPVCIRCWSGWQLSLRWDAHHQKHNALYIASCHSFAAARRRTTSLATLHPTKCLFVSVVWCPCSLNHSHRQTLVSDSLDNCALSTAARMTATTTSIRSCYKIHREMFRRQQRYRNSSSSPYGAKVRLPINLSDAADCEVMDEVMEERAAWATELQQTILALYVTRRK